MCAPLLRSDIPRPTAFERNPAPVAESYPIRWWEDAPGARSKIKERVYSVAERELRAGRWWRAHPEQIVTCSANAWPPIALHLSDYEHAGE